MTLVEENEGSMARADDVAASWRFQHSLDLGLLQQCIDELAAGHGLALDHGDGAEWKERIPVVELTGATDAEAQVDEWIAQEIGQPFVRQGAALRARLARLAADESVLLLILNAAAAQGRSVSLLMRELSTAYGARPPAPSGAELADAPPPTRGWLHGDALKTHLEFWNNYLDGAPRALELPTDLPRPHALGHRAGWVNFAVEPRLERRLQELSNALRHSLPTLLLAAFNVLLYRYSAQDEIGVAWSCSAREHVAANDGSEVISIVRSRVQAEQGFGAFLDQVQASVAASSDYRGMPWDQLVHLLAPLSDPSRHPLCQAFFAFESLDRMNGPGSRVKPLRSSRTRRARRPDLALFIAETKDGIVGGIEYAADLFLAETIERFAGHFKVLLDGIADQPHRHLDDVSLLSEPERHRLLREWNDTKAEYPRDRTLHRLFEEQAARTPDRLAVSCGDDRLTFRQINARANQLARFLRRYGIKAGSLVGVCLSRGAGMVAVVLGVLKAGAAYVPLDPDYPTERVRFIIADTGLGIVLTDEIVSSRLPAGLADILSLERHEIEIVAEDDSDCDSGAGPDDLCFVVYTSGSTGLPKGVGSPHRSSVVMFSWMWDAYPFGPDDIFCQRTTLNFVVSVWEIFLPLLKGVPIVVVPDDIVKEPGRLIDHLAHRRVTRILLVPSLLASLLDTVVGLGYRAPLLKFWVLVGEPLSAGLAARFEQSAPGATLLNLYGTSETHSAASFSVRNGSRLARVPIGRPLANRRVYILDGRLNPQPVGVPGEIYIAGDGLSVGYISRPELSAERFIADPFSDKEGGILYRTGDRARYLSDGNIEFLGRMDNQVQIRGFRVELGEVETVLQRYPAVARCVAAAWSSGEDEQRLVAYVVPARKGCTVSELRAFLSERLPDYMVPSTFTFLDALPMTPNGKIDRRALPVPTRDRPELSERFVAPRTPTECALAEICRNVLSLDSIGIRDNFFDVGGYSNKIIVMIVRIRELFGVRLSVADVFECQTVERLAQRVDMARDPSRRSPQDSPPTRVVGEI